MFFFTTALLATLASSVTSFSSPTENDQPLKAELLPLRGTRAAAFVPNGWQQERLVTGDLNGDKRPDQALVLVERYSPLAPEASRQRALVVLLAEPNGQFRRVGAAGKLLYCTGCLDAATGNDGMPDISIKDSQLVVRHVSGNAEEALTLTQRFRYEATPGRVRLISEEQLRSALKKVNTTVKQTDYLTGQQKTERIYQEPGGGSKQLMNTTTATVPTTERYLEDVDNHAK